MRRSGSCGANLGEVRSIAVREDMHGHGLSEVLFERCGFTVHSRESLPRKVWTDCVRCPRRHACDEVAVVLDLVPGASEAAAREGRSFSLPIPQRPRIEPALPIVS